VFKKKNHEHEEANVNIASIIDCFTVIITYLLSAASLVSISALEAGLISQSNDPIDPNQKPKETIELSVRNTGVIDLFFRNAEGNTQRLSFKAEESGEISSKVTEYKKQYPELKYISLFSEDKVQYEFLTKVVSTQKNILPVVFVGGSSFGNL
jgi:biopolymer transport protein ExbD